MHRSLRPLPRFAGMALAALALGFTPVVVAAEPTAEVAAPSVLTSNEQTAAGLAKLTAGQRAALEAQIVREITLARQGDVVGFSTTFTSRRTADERQAAGLDQLTPGELAQLDTGVARAVAERPSPYDYAYARQPVAATAVSLKRRPEIHGEVSFVYGWGSGDREFYGGSVVTSYYDPESKVGITVGVSQLRGNGFGYYGYPGYWGYYDRPWYAGYYDYPGYYGFYDYPSRYGYRGAAGFYPVRPRGRW
ncbi:MAG TPA: hypothetical protein VGD81_20730 [Opitutaceae bacterium]